MRLLTQTMGGRTELDLLGQLKKEHQEIRELLRVAETIEPNHRKALLRKIEETMITHARAEEKAIYSIARRRARNRNQQEAFDATMDAFEEHRVLDLLWADLNAISVYAPEWKPRLRALRDNVEHHIQEAEKEIFSLLRNFFSSMEREILLEDYLDAKKLYSEVRPTQEAATADFPGCPVSP